MKIVNVDGARRGDRLELRIPQSNDVSLRQHLAELHLISAAVEGFIPCGEDWATEYVHRRRDSEGVVSIILPPGPSVVTALAHETLQEIIARLERRSPPFPLAGARRTVVTPFQGFRFTFDANAKGEPFLLIRAPEPLAMRQFFVMLHLIAAAVEFASPSTAEWALQIRQVTPMSAKMQIRLYEWSDEEARQSYRALTHVAALCRGVALSGYERLAAPQVASVWPALASHVWAAPVALHLWT